MSLRERMEMTPTYVHSCFGVVAVPRDGGLCRLLDVAPAVRAIQPIWQYCRLIRAVSSATG